MNQPSKRSPLQSKQEYGFEYQAYSNFNDVWAHAEELDLCAFCSHEVAPNSKRCANCKRQLFVKQLRYKRPSNNFHIYWVLVLSMGQLFMLQSVLDVIGNLGIGLAMLHGALAAVLIGLTPFIYKRYVWAFYASMVTLFMGGLLLITTDIVADALAVTLTGATMQRTPLFGFTQGISNWIVYAIRILHIAALVVALFLGFVQVSPDVSRDDMWLVARLSRKAKGAGHNYRLGESFQKQGMLALAILHWRKAAALDPSRLSYHLTLAQGYMQLGFYTRALDVLKSAQTVSTTPAGQAKIAEMQLRVESAAKQS